MSSYIQPMMKTYCADAAIPQYSFVKFGSSDKHVAFSLAAEKAIGVCMNDGVANANDAVEVAHLGGGALIKSAGVIARGDSIKSDATGKAVVAAAGEWAPGIAMESAVAGDVIHILLNGHQAI